MKNYLIIVLAEGAFMKASTNTLDAGSAYKLIRAKKEISDAYREVASQREALVAEILTPEERARINDPKLKDKVARLQECLSSFVMEDTDVKLSPVPFADWHRFCAENGLKVGGLEIELEGILWEAPEESD